MKRIVTHKSPDMDAIGASWILLRFLPGWEDAEMYFVPAGDKYDAKYENEGEVIEIADGIETIHVDTGMGKLDHHQTQDTNVCAASLALDYALTIEDTPLNNETKREAVRRIVDLIVDEDHFQQFFYPDPSSDRHDITMSGILQGYKIKEQRDDMAMFQFGVEILDSLVYTFESKIWAENEIAEKGIEFETKWGKGLGVETLNDRVLKLAQLRGYSIVVRKDPNYGFIRIKARPTRRVNDGESRREEDDIDLTPIYEKIKEKDPRSSWFLHVSKRMLLNGSSKNPEMKGSDLTLDEIIEIFRSVSQ